jgi:hypothetical protein
MTEVGSPSERARTILASSSSVEVTSAAGGTAPQDWMLRSLVLSAGSVPSRSVLPVEVEVADAAPLPVRDRIRARVRVAGSTTPEPDCDALHVHARRVTLVEDGTSTDIAVDDLLAAEPDLLHDVEASVLGHLDSAHGDVVETLTRLLDARHLLGVVRVWPYRLDRHGLVLRLEYVTGHADHRLAFPAPLPSADRLSHEMTLLIARAASRPAPCARHPRPSGALAPILRAAAAAQRLCSPQHDEPA